ncbi:hypothetical protein RHGRI_005299 [Rhododendron griersonianum]|uniref:Uncharacterized protein n=1 Tax=Rhododendron griersonianum TaxID=479676 RepID=A0AAV6LC22_9ERIC|nr:hypothetical protein RHGRI_005299 [Rhododendron griersonianum]
MHITTHTSKMSKSLIDGGGRNIDAYNTESFVENMTRYKVFDEEHTSLRHLVVYGGPPSG